MDNLLCDAALAGSPLAEQVAALGQALPDQLPNDLRQQLVYRMGANLIWVVPPFPGQCIVPIDTSIDEILGLDRALWNPLGTVAACMAMHVLSKNVRINVDLLQDELNAYNATLRGQVHKLYKKMLFDYTPFASVVYKLREGGSLQAAGKLYCGALTSDSWIDLKKAEAASGSWTERHWELFNHWMKLSAIGVSDTEIEETIETAARHGLPIPDELRARSWRSWTSWLKPNLGWEDVGWGQSEVARIGEDQCRNFIRSWRPAPKDSGPAVAFEKTFSLRAPSGKRVSAFADKYSAPSGADEYFATLGTAKVALKFNSIHNGRTAAEPPLLQSGDEVRVQSTETGLGEHKFLGKFHPACVYYYQGGYDEQKWRVVKVAQSDGPIRAGEAIFIVHASSGGYLCARDDGYMGTSAEPFGESDNPHWWYVDPI
jgi:hypothetical protein